MDTDGEGGLNPVCYNAGMDLIEALHNAARQYCIDYAASWRDRYAQLMKIKGEKAVSQGGAWDYSPAAYDLFPRYQILSAIQNEVEQFLPGDFASLDDARATLSLAGETAQNEFTKQRNPIAIAADAEERKKFSSFVSTVDEAHLSNQRQLPFRHVLGKTRTSELSDALNRKWGKWYGGYCDRQFAAADVVTLHVAAMEHPGSYEHIQSILAGRGITQILELREWGNNVELRTQDADFTYNGAEGFWTSPDMEWLVYASHEASITFGSSWLVEAMRTFLPEFQRFIYKGYELSAYS
jgi:hypothetical protein